MIISQLTHESHDYLLIELIKDYEEALKILGHVNKNNISGELTALYSDVITEIRGEIHFKSERIEWMGFDVYNFHGGSLILDGIFFKPEYFSKWLGIINENGLFPSKNRIDEFVQDYMACVNENIVEYYDPSSQIMDLVRIGRVLI